jgi:hypothetical protein
MMTNSNYQESAKTQHQNYSSMKKTYQIETAKLVSSSAARWRAIKKYPVKNQQHNNEKLNDTKKETPYIHTTKIEPY